MSNKGAAMKHYVRATSVVLLFGAIGWPNRTEGADGPIIAEIRVQMGVDGVGGAIVCNLHNGSEDPVRCMEMLSGGNTLSFMPVRSSWDKGMLQFIGYSRRLAPGQTHSAISVGSMQTKQWAVPTAELLVRLGNRAYGQYVQLQWHLAVLRQTHESIPLCVGFPNAHGTMSAPLVSTDEVVRPVLALVFPEGGHHDVAFLLLNGTDADVSLPSPLVNDSRLVITAHLINYSNEVYSVEANPELVRVEPGKTHEWRIPWITVFARLPEADRAQLQAAKDIDLVWKAGTHVSSPLPLTLPDPE